MGVFGSRVMACRSTVEQGKSDGIPSARLPGDTPVIGCGGHAEAGDLRHPGLRLQLSTNWQQALDRLDAPPGQAVPSAQVSAPPTGGRNFSDIAATNVSGTHIGMGIIGPSHIACGSIRQIAPLDAGVNNLIVGMHSAQAVTQRPLISSDLAVDSRTRVGSFRVCPSLNAQLCRCPGRPLGGSGAMTWLGGASTATCQLRGE